MRRPWRWTSDAARGAPHPRVARGVRPASVEDFFGIPAAAVKFLPKGFNPQSIVKAETKRASKGDGTTTREGALIANITVRVTALDPNGNLYVRGDKIVSVNRENQHIVL